MKTRIGALVTLFLTLTSTGICQRFDHDFTGATMRLDFYHTGSTSQEYISLDRTLIEGPWAGSRTHLIDQSNLGKYFFEVVDLGTNRTLYSQGFSSIYGEWETTAKAKREAFRTLPEGIRFPEPRRPVQIRLRKRGPDQSFLEIWSTQIEPTSRFVARPAIDSRDILLLAENGLPSRQVDLLLLGDGYTRKERREFERDAKRFMKELFSVEPFGSRRNDFTLRAIFVPSAESGISRPRAGVFHNTPLGTSYNSLDSERYILSVEDRKWRDIAAAAPHDFVIILVNNQKYGGGGIYRLYATAAASSDFSSYLFVHEFGHSFAGLADEYYTSDVAYEDFIPANTEPWEPNITSLLDPGSLKWSELVQEGTPIPTPWSKKEYEEASRSFEERRRKLRAKGASEEALEHLFEEQRSHFFQMLSTQEHSTAVGAFEGASYQAKGLFRPEISCIMFSRSEKGFCRVCRQAINRAIDLQVK